MERATVDRYETDGLRWASRRPPVRHDDAAAFGASVADGHVRLDVGAGAGRYTAELGEPVVALDAARTMLDELGRLAPRALRVQADLEALPLRPGAAAAAWSNMAYHHIQRVRLPMALSDLHGALEVGSPVDVQVLRGDYEGDAYPPDDIGGRYFAAWTEPAWRDVLEGAGFAVEGTRADEGTDVVQATARRALTLADTVGAGMRLLVCGLNPSVYSAERGVGYARPGNRFWPAALAAGIVSRTHAPRHALTEHGVGMTDLCKRATVASRELTKAEYRAGAARVERLVRWLRPGAVCFVGLEGWRAAVDAQALAGVQPDGFAGRPAYVMPSTSGLNAHSRLGDLTAHLRAAAALADGDGEGGGEG